MATVDPQSIDVLVVDMEDGSMSDNPNLVAPPSFAISADFLPLLASAMAEGGVIAWNAIGSTEALDGVADEIAAGLPENYTHGFCNVPACVDKSGRHRIVFSRCVAKQLIECFLIQCFSGTVLSVAEYSSQTSLARCS